MTGTEASELLTAMSILGVVIGGFIWIVITEMNK
jgi:hypothetical protein